MLNNETRKIEPKKILGRIFASLGLFLCLVAFVLWLFKVEKVVDSYEVELGTAFNEDISAYLSGKAIALSSAKPDFSNVDTSKTGKYSVKVDYFFKTYEYDIIVADTIAPKVFFNTDNYVCEPYMEIESDFFVQSVVEYDDYKLTYLVLSDDAPFDKAFDGSSVVFTKPGVCDIVLRATDMSGNYSDYYLSVVVDTAPVIYGNYDYYLAAGSDFDPLNGIFSYDETDGELTNQVKAYVSSDLTNPGDANIEYVVTDSCGLTTRVSGLIHVYDPLLLQDMVNLKKLDPFDENVIGVINPYDCGYLLESDCEAAVENIKPAVVRVYYETTTTRTYGSGYIVKITDDKIIVCTNKHVIGSQNEVKVCLYDGTVVTGHVAGRQTAPDIAFVVIDRNQYPNLENLELKTIHINLNYYNSLSNQPYFDMGMYCINNDGTEWLTHYGKIIRKSGVLDEYFVNYDYPVTEISVELIGGVSGSAIIDEHGNLLCMATFYWVNNGTKEYYGVSLNDILDFYEITFGERLEYY